MTPLHELHNGFLLIPVPEDAFSLRIDIAGTRTKLTALLSETTTNGQWNKTWEWYLPPGNWQYITTSDVITEEQAEQICPGKWPEYFENATRPGHKDFSDNIYRDITALDSFKSLLRSLNLKRAAVLKKKL